MSKNILKLGMDVEVEGRYKGYLLINERYEDDERFYKNTWLCATPYVGAGEDYVWVKCQVPNTSSYTQWSEAMKNFKILIDNEFESE